MNLNLTRKVVIVTGASSGIGAEIARRYAKEGAIPVLVGRDEKRGRQVLEEIQIDQPQAILISKELSDPNHCKEVVEETLRVFDRIDVLVNNAGGNDSVGLNQSPDAFMQSIARNLLHVFSMTHYALEALKKSKGSIVNIGSKVAETGQGGTSGYAASKGGMRALTREWALDLRHYGIRVNEVIPAEVMTLSYQTWIQTFPEPEKKMAEIVKHIPLGQRFTTPEEIADMVLFLSSDRSSHTTGQHIYVDGGYTHLDRSIDF